MLLSIGQGAARSSDQQGGAPHVSARTIDEIFAAIAAEIPGFAGVIVSPTEELVVSIAGNAIVREEELRVQLAQVVGYEAFVFPLRFHQVAFDWPQLMDWHSRVVLDALALPGVASVDLDESRNIIRIGVTSAAARSTLSALASQRGVPSAAILIQDEEPMQFSASVQDFRRPLVGGIRIARPLSGTLEAVCTLGFNAVRAGIDGFVTNSHCTAVQGRSNDGSTFYQNSSFLPTHLVGSETHDPPYTVTPCPSGKVCRYSDTAFIQFNVLGIEQRGALARAVLGSTSWNGIDLFRISAEEIPVVGRAVEKVGQTTGRTSGSVTATCVARNVSGTNIHFPCQTDASYSSDLGDSGSPVYRITNSPATNDVSLLGIHWGRSSTTVTFSGIDMISRSSEMGSVATCDAAFSC